MRANAGSIDAWDVPGSESDDPTFSGEKFEVTDSDLARIGALVRAHFGIQITQQKRALVSARLNKRVRELGCKSFSEYCDKLEADQSGRLVSDLANRISTNHTFFFREAPHFKLLSEKVLPPLVQRLRDTGSLDLRLWCAACASGEEAYTLAMLINEALGVARVSWKAGLLATDISEKALQAAMAGVYTEERVAEVPSLFKTRYLRPLPDGSFAVSDQLKSDVTFRRFNLMNDHFRFRRQFHVIFCRNVMIYFDMPTREKLVASMCEVLEPGGYLFIGHSESLGRNPPGLTCVQPAVYRKDPLR